MKAIACAIVFAALWLTPTDQVNSASEGAKGFVAFVCIVMFCAFFAFMLTENER